jgi:hypothetical protein
MKSPKKNGIGEVVTEYGARVMKVIKKGLLGRSLFDFYGDIKAQAFRTKELDSVPTTPSDKKGGIIYTKSADGKLYYKSNEVSEVELSSQGTNTTYSVSCVDGDNSDEEKIRLTGSDSSTDDVVLEAGTGLSIARDGDKITFTNTVTDTDTVLTTEQVQDIAGALIATGGTKTNIAVTYDDANNNMDFVVASDLNTTGTAGGLSSTLVVSSGGTGATTFTSGQILRGNGTSALTADNNLKFDGSSFSIISSTSARPQVLISNTNSDAEAPSLAFDRTSTVGADGDDIGVIRFDAEDASGNGPHTYAQILGEIQEADDGSEEGRLTFSVASHDAELQPGLKMQSGDAEDEVDVTVGSGTTSLTTIAGDLGISGGNITTAVEVDGLLTAGANIKVGGSGSDSNNWISIDAQDGDDSSGGGITFYETGTYSVNAPQYGAKIVYNEDADEFAIGTMHNNVFMRQIFMPRGTDFVYLADGAVVEGTTPVLQLRDSSTTVADGDDIGAIKWVNEDDDGVTLEVRGVATENHASGANGGSKLEFYVTPNTTSATALAATIDQNKDLIIEGDFQVKGNDIKDDDGTTCITFDSSGNTTIAGTLAVADIDVTSTAGQSLTITAGAYDNPVKIVGGDSKVFTAYSDNSTAGTNTIGVGALGDDSYFRNDEGSFKFYVANDATVGAELTQAGNLTILGDLKVTGNDIKDSGGNTIISSDGSGVVTMAGGNIAVGGSNANFNMNSGSDIILEADNNGGGNTSTIQYPDSGGTNRIILGADSDVAILSNRASNGTVQIRANTSTAGSSGEVTVATFADTEVTFSKPLVGDRKIAVSSGTDGNVNGGDIVYFGGTTSMTVGRIYHYRSTGAWEIANADAVATCDGLLGVALGSASDTHGVLLRGMVTLDHDPGAVGDVLYVQSDNAGTTGHATATAPSASGDCVRIVGYCVHASAGNIWFNPDSTFVEVA